MIVLDNYSEKNTYIIVTEEGYSIVDENSINGIENGEGGFDEDNELLGIYVENEKLYFQYKDKKHQTKPDEIICTNEWLKGNKRIFKVKIKDTLVCNIIYKPYVNPLALVFEDDEDEFDFLLHLSKLMKSKESISNFIKGINNLNNYNSSKS